MNISLPEELKRYVEAQTRAGYSTPSEFVRELIRQDRRRRSQENLEQLLVEGLDSGESIAVDDRFRADLKREALKMMHMRKRKSKTRHK